MNLFKEFISTYGVTLLYAVVTAIAGFVGVALKKLYEKVCNDRTKKDVVKTCVIAIEQIYMDLHGEEKYQKCVESASNMLMEQGIRITDLELKMLIEAAVHELNASFNSYSGTPQDPEAEIGGIGDTVEPEEVECEDEVEELPLIGIGDTVEPVVKE